MKIWVHIDGRQLGPYNPDQLPLDEMDATTPVWYDGLEQWTPAGQAPATASLFLPPEPPAAPVCADDRQDDTAGDVEAEIEIITSETEETPLSTDSPDTGAPETDDTENDPQENKAGMSGIVWLILIAGVGGLLYALISTGTLSNLGQKIRRGANEITGGALGKKKK